MALGAAEETLRRIEAVWRIESTKLIAGLLRLTRDVGQAEELAQEALVAALERWPEAGVPDNPGAWLMTTAKNRALDDLRRRKLPARRASGARDASWTRSRRPPPGSWKRVWNASWTTTWGTICCA